MSRMMLCLCLVGCFSLTIAAAADKPNMAKSNGNRLTYLDEPCNPWYPHRDFPKLTTPMWVGEEGVEAVVILGIDDMRGHEKWEAYLRPILNRLKQIDGRAPVSIFTCSIDPRHPHLQQWLEEGLSLEIHTIDHPCPLLKDGDLAKAKSTVDRCIDLLNEVPNNKPVCFRMPCCDSLNTLSPRFYTEIFNKTTELSVGSGEGGAKKGGNFLLANSSVMQVFTSDDPALPRELVLEAVAASNSPLPTPNSRLTRERFKKYLPTDRFFTNSIENYPYPFVVDRLCWEFPCVAPSDWAAQHFHKPDNPQTIEDWKAALDCTVIKQGVYCLVFHPHNWIKPEQINELIDHAVTKHGKKIKFLNFREAVERLNKNVAFGGLRDSSNGGDANVRFADLSRDGLLDVLRLGKSSFRMRIWEPTNNSWLNASALPSLFEKTTTWLKRFDAHDELPRNVPKPIEGRDDGIRLVDLDEDGHDDIVFSNHERYGIWLWESLKTGWSREVLSGQRGDKLAEQELPPIVRADGSNNGFWVHARQLVWMNEDTAKSKDLVERRSFDQLLANETPGPKLPEASLKMMQVKPGYRVELVAAEPLVRAPVAFDWGPDGKLWVAEMADYPLGVGEGEEADGEDSVVRRSASQTHDAERRATLLKQAGHKLGGGRVRFLEDTDGDGKYDKSIVFLDKLNFPNGVMPWRDGVLISAAPDVLFARDTNGDGRADGVKVLLTGFGEGNQQHRVNGFSWGLDNMVHCANGDSGGQIKVVSTVGWVESSRPTNPDDAKSKDGGSRGSTHPTNYIGKVIDIRGRDFRWNPDTGELDPTSGQTQFGRNRDDFGNWFGNNNANPMYHFVLDDYYTRRNPHVAAPDPRKQVSITPGPSPVFPISRTLARFNDFAMANRFTSANSAMVYRDDLLFRSPVAPRQESRTGPDSPSPADSPKKVDVRSADPVAERQGYVAHVFISEPVHNLVHHEVMTADGVTFTSRRAEDEQQSEFFASRDNWFRPTQLKTGPDGALYIADMYRQVIEHPQYIPPALQEKLDLRAGHDKGRIYRVIPADGFVKMTVPWPMDKASDKELIRTLYSSTGTVRDLAHRMLLWRYSGQDAKSIVTALRKTALEEEVNETEVRGSVGLSWSHSSPHGRLHALSLLDAFHSLTVDDLSRALRDKHPAVRRRALQAVESVDGDLPDPLINQLSGMGRDPDPFVRMQFAYTLGHPKFASLGNELGKLLYRERNEKYLVAAAMSSIHAKNVASVVANVFESAGKEPLPPQLASTLLGLASTLGNDQALLSLIEYVLSGAATSESQPIVLAQMLDNLERRKTSLAELKEVDPQRLARAQQQLASRIDTAREVIAKCRVQSAKCKVEDVVFVLPLLGRDSAKRGDDAKLVGEVLVPQSPVPVQTAVVATLARINHEASATALLSGWRTFTPALRTQVLDALLSRPNWTGTLLDQLEAKSIAPSDIDATRRQRLTAHANKDLRERAAKLLDVSVNTDRQKMVAEFAVKLKELNAAGDAVSGSEVFKKRCATCHKLKEIGTSVGSDLMSLTDKSTTALLTAILDPNKAVEAKFLAYTAVNKQGQTFSGLIAAETGNSITLMAADGKQHTLLRADLDEFISSGKSFMPEGLEKDVLPRELADVIAFVQSSGPPPKKFDGNQPEPVTADASGTLKLLATNAEIYGKTLVFEPPFKNLGFWGSVDDRAVWTINVSKAGKYSIRLNYACDNGTAGNDVVFDVAEQSVKAKIVGTGSWENYQTAILGELNLPAGQHRLTVRATETLKNHLMDFKELRLVPE